MPERFDTIIIGAGIVGLANALQAGERGRRTLVLDRSPFAQGASIRNFGMVWPIGQPAGPNLRNALRTREIWLEVLRAAGIWHNVCGSVHLVSCEDEAQVLREFADVASIGHSGYRVEYLSRDAAIARSPAARKDRVIAGLWSETEVCVDSPRTIAALPSHFASRYPIEFRWNTPVTGVASGVVHTPAGALEASRIIVCSGADLEQLYPELYRGLGIRKCKLHMLAAEAQPNNWQLGPMIASGLTLRHYECFANCPTLQTVKARIARDQPLLDHFGIHVMASQHASGEIILGDSHEYDADITPFDKTEIDDLILAELRALIDLPSWRISRRWTGIYAKRSGFPVFTASPVPGVHVMNIVGGSGMTMSFGLAEQLWNTIE